MNINPYAAYYADYASPFMFVIALGHLYAWTGDKAIVRRHWDTARRIMAWAHTYGDADHDGYLEYLTRSGKGTKNQGWKDSGDANENGQSHAELLKKHGTLHLIHQQPPESLSAGPWDRFRALLDTGIH